MKLSQWAKEKGLSYRRAWQHFKEGKIPGAYKLDSGTIVIPDYDADREEKIAVYARVSSGENKKNLEAQSERLVSYCNAKGWKVEKVVKEVGSGLNDKRVKLEKLLKDQSITIIVVEHADRFSRFGLNYILSLLEMQGRRIEIVNKQLNDRDDLMQDFVSIITSFTAGLYGLRRSKRKTEQLIKGLEEDEVSRKTHHKKES